MKNKRLISGINLWLVSLVFLLPRCTSPDQNRIANVAVHKTDTVIIHQMQFSPATITVNNGDTIVWINKDLVDHDVTALQKNSFYSDTIAVGKTWKMAISDSAAYRCSIHPVMKGQILLE